MLEQFLSSEFVTKLNTSFSEVYDYLFTYISGINNVKLTALILIISALSIFVFLIIVVIIRNIVNLFSPRQSKFSSASVSSTYDDDSPFNEEERQELELELQKELDLALAQRAEMEQKKEREQKSSINLTAKETKKDISPSEDKTKQIEESDKTRYSQNRKNFQIDLDWQKQKVTPDPIKKQIEPSMLSYQQLHVELNQLLGLLVDMLGRGIDDLKIAQTLNYKTQGLEGEDHILKIIDAVKQFISLCQNGKFTTDDENLPSIHKALYHLANNDVSLALILLEDLMDKSVDKTTGLSEAKRQQSFIEISNYACCLGTLAETNDFMLATSVYEMAIELNSANATAWCRLGDVYRKTNSESRAIWAYQNAYSFADSEINAAELAAASKHLSDYLYAQGNTLQAAKMHNIAKQYYDSLGINNRFNQQELEAIHIIENNHQKNLPETITKLLASSGREAV